MPPAVASASGRALHTLLPHVRQVANWDCGLACAAALLSLRRGADGPGGSAEHELAALVAGAGTSHSVWTIDLLRLLGARGLRATLHTTAPRATRTHGAMEFYNAGAAAGWEADAARVDAAFAAAAAEGMPVREVSLPWSYLRQRLRPGENAGCGGRGSSSSSSSVFVALLDRRYYRCVTCGNSVATGGGGAAPTPVPVPHATPPLDSAGYRGHYVVLTRVLTAAEAASEGVGAGAGVGSSGHGVGDGSGCSEGETEVVELLDPFAAEHRCVIPVAQLEAARRAEGTDEDLLECVVDDVHGWVSSASGGGEVQPGGEG